MNEIKRPSRLARLILFASSWLSVAGLAALQVAPHVPRTLIGWVVFVVFAPPLYALGDFAAEKYTSDWRERTLLQKVLKATGLVVGMLIVMIIALLFMGP